MSVARFLGRIPMVFNIAVISPHGYFAQSGVLGKPDTGGQVVYILDQVRAVEREMFDFIDRQGLEVEPRIIVVTRLIPKAEGTTCYERLEPIVGTRNARILRIPFARSGAKLSPIGSPDFKSGRTSNVLRTDVPRNRGRIGPTTRPHYRQLF